MNQPDLFGGPLAESTARIVNDTKAMEAAAMRRDVGVARSARRQGEEWTERAIGYVMEFAAKHREAFLCEDVRDYAGKRGFAAEQPKAWGQVMRAAARRGIVRSCGYAPANSSNRSPKCLWIGRA